MILYHLSFINMDRADEAFELMSSRRMNCAQTILSIYSSLFGMDRSLALQLAQGFGSGMGRAGKTCGAVSGAYMVLGLANKISPDNPRQRLDHVYDLTREFTRKFEEIHASILCRDLTGYDVSKPEELAEARNRGIFTIICPVLVRDSARILESMLGLELTGPDKPG
jgi:C_GCAxxG_C_C family probable redox protein